MLLFSALSVGASAVKYDETFFGPNDGQAGSHQVVLSFNFNGGTNKYDLEYVSGGEFVIAKAGSYAGTYYMIPHDTNEQLPGTKIALPKVNPPSGYVFDGWECNYDGGLYAASAVATYVIPEAAGKVVSFTAIYSAGEVEADTMDTIMGILSKVFGAIIGILMYGGDTEAGVALMDKLLGGLDL